MIIDMLNTIKKIWIIGLCLASLCLAGCFHIPDEDWLPSKNKVKPVETDNEFDEALDIFVQWMDALSAQREQRKNSDDLLTEDEIWYWYWTEESTDDEENN